MVSVQPSPVPDGSRLTVTVRIDQPLPQEATEEDKIRGGIIVWDPSDSDSATELIAFVFRANQQDRTMSYLVVDDQEYTPNRRIRIAVNPNWDDETPHIAQEALR